MRLISFTMTQEQILDRTKTVTRRLGWRTLEPGARLRAVHQAMGLRRGQHPRTLATIEVLRVTRERLDEITADDVAREGYPGMSPAAFVEHFCAAMRCERSAKVTRIEFAYVEATR